MNKILLITLIVFSAFLSSCGTKGALYIPEERYPQSETHNNYPDIYSTEYQTA
ncbi:lipoprotein [Methylophilaceae bacterium]|nr:lipoprotein [Methylophilaceae bacterium]